MSEINTVPPLLKSVDSCNLIDKQERYIFANEMRISVNKFNDNLGIESLSFFLEDLENRLLQYGNNSAFKSLSKYLKFLKDNTNETHLDTFKANGFDELYKSICKNFLAEEYSAQPDYKNRYIVLEQVYNFCVKVLEKETPYDINNLQVIKNCSSFLIPIMFYFEENKPIKDYEKLEEYSEFLDEVKSNNSAIDDLFKYNKEMELLNNLLKLSLYCFNSLHPYILRSDCEFGKRKNSIFDIDEILREINHISDLFIEFNQVKHTSLKFLINNLVNPINDDLIDRISDKYDTYISKFDLILSQIHGYSAEWPMINYVSIAVNKYEHELFDILKDTNHVDSLYRYKHIESEIGEITELLDEIHKQYQESFDLYNDLEIFYQNLKEALEDSKELYQNTIKDNFCFSTDYNVLAYISEKLDKTIKVFISRIEEFHLKIENILNNIHKIYNKTDYPYFKIKNLYSQHIPNIQKKFLSLINKLEEIVILSSNVRVSIVNLNEENNLSIDQLLEFITQEWAYLNYIYTYINNHIPTKMNESVFEQPKTLHITNIQWYDSILNHIIPLFKNATLSVSNSFKVYDDFISEKNLTNDKYKIFTNIFENQISEWTKILNDLDNNDFVKKIKSYNISISNPPNDHFNNFTHIQNYLKKFEHINIKENENYLSADINYEIHEKSNEVMNSIDFSKVENPQLSSFLDRCYNSVLKNMNQMSVLHGQSNKCITRMVIWCDELQEEINTFQNLLKKLQCIDCFENFAVSIEKYNVWNIKTIRLLKLCRIIKPYILSDSSSILNQKVLNRVKDLFSTREIIIILIESFFSLKLDNVWELKHFSEETFQKLLISGKNMHDILSTNLLEVTQDPYSFEKCKSDIIQTIEFLNENTNEKLLENQVLSNLRDDYSTQYGFIIITDVFIHEYYNEIIPLKSLKNKIAEKVSKISDVMNKNAEIRINLVNFLSILDNCYHISTILIDKQQSTPDFNSKLSYHLNLIELKKKLYDLPDENLFIPLKKMLKKIYDDSFSKLSDEHKNLVDKYIKAIENLDCCLISLRSLRIRVQDIVLFKGNYDLENIVNFRDNLEDIKKNENFIQAYNIINILEQDPIDDPRINEETQKLKEDYNYINNGTKELLRFFDSISTFDKQIKDFINERNLQIDEIGKKLDNYVNEIDLNIDLNKLIDTLTLKEDIVNGINNEYLNIKNKKEQEINAFDEIASPTLQDYWLDLLKENVLRLNSLNSELSLETEFLEKKIKNAQKLDENMTEVDKKVVDLENSVGKLQENVASTMYKHSEATKKKTENKEFDSENKKMLDLIENFFNNVENSKTHHGVLPLLLEKFKKPSEIKSILMPDAEEIIINEDENESPYEADYIKKEFIIDNLKRRLEALDFESIALRKRILVSIAEKDLLKAKSSFNDKKSVFDSQLNNMDDLINAIITYNAIHFCGKEIDKHKNEGDNVLSEYKILKSLYDEKLENNDLRPDELDVLNDIKNCEDDINKKIQTLKNLFDEKKAKSDDFHENYNDHILLCDKLNSECNDLLDEDDLSHVNFEQINHLLKPNSEFYQQYQDLKDLLSYQVPLNQINNNDAAEKIQELDDKLIRVQDLCQKLKLKESETKPMENLDDYLNDLEEFVVKLEDMVSENITLPDIEPELNQYEKKRFKFNVLVGILNEEETVEDEVIQEAKKQVDQLDMRVENVIAAVNDNKSDNESDASVSSVLLFDNLDDLIKSLKKSREIDSDDDSISLDAETEKLIKHCSNILTRNKDDDFNKNADLISTINDLYEDLLNKLSKQANNKLEKHSDQNQYNDLLDAFDKWLKNAEKMQSIFNKNLFSHKRFNDRDINALKNEINRLDEDIKKKTRHHQQLAKHFNIHGDKDLKVTDRFKDITNRYHRLRSSVAYNKDFLDRYSNKVEEFTTLLYLFNTDLNSYNLTHSLNPVNFNEYGILKSNFDKSNDLKECMNNKTIQMKDKLNHISQELITISNGLKPKGLTQLYNITMKKYNRLNMAINRIHNQIKRDLEEVTRCLDMFNDFSSWLQQKEKEASLLYEEKFAIKDLLPLQNFHMKHSKFMAQALTHKRQYDALLIKYKHFPVNEHTLKNTIAFCKLANGLIQRWEEFYKKLKAFTVPIKERLSTLHKQRLEKNFKWSVWRNKLNQHLNDNKIKLDQIWPKKKGKDGKDMYENLTESKFYSTIMKTNFPINYTHMKKVFELLSRNGRRVEYDDFMDALQSKAEAPVFKEKECNNETEHINNEIEDELNACTCDIPFTIIRIDNNKILVGRKNKQVLIRVVKSCVMVRVGGGWEKLKEFIYKNDPCRMHQKKFLLNETEIGNLKTGTSFMITPTQLEESVSKIPKLKKN